jgi:predicted Zn-dependent protease
LPITLKRTPSDGQLLATAGDLDARTGRLATGLERLDRARRVDPRSVGIVSIQAAWLLYARRYAEADSVALSGLEIDPASVTLAQLRAQAALGVGDLSGAERVARAFLDSPGVDRAAAAVYFALYWDLYWILSGTDQRLVLAQPAEAFGGAGHRAAVHMQLERLRGDSLLARTWADSTLQAFPNRPGATGAIRITRALALGQLGRAADAEAEADRALALAAVSDPIEHAYHTHQLARIRALTGDYAGAAQALKRVLAMPYVISPAWLRIDPSFATLRGTPAFDSLTLAPR